MFFIKNIVLIWEEDNCYRANKERAFMNMIYLNKNYYFDNLRTINWQKCLIGRNTKL